MYKIIKKELLAPNIYRMDIAAPRVACSAKPGQFIILRLDEKGERIPLTIADYDAAEGWVTIVTQTVGYSTTKLCAMNPGDELADFAGPLGRPSDFVHEDIETLRSRKILFIAGGVGTAPVYPQVKWLSQHGIKADVIIGARSALFAPTERLGLIIIDEEHDGAYKSDTSPKYHARETAVYRAGLCGASVVLGSATPSVEAYARALSGEYKLWTLKKRAGNAMLPTTQIIDLREEFKKGNRSIFSGELHKKIEERLAKKEQIMLFLNRRGFAGFVSCRACGQVIKCPHCDVTLTYHRNGKLRCHYCGYEETFIKQCPICKSSHVAAFGLGTEKVEAALHAEFPTARVLRMDMDTTRRKHAHEEMLAAFSKGEADILLGTQMIVKGHDYANVTLVGILAADLSLHEQDFRSGEKTFQLLCQAAGRAGRGDKRGDVIIQTYSPEHYSITTAAEHSYENFFKEEYTYRQLMGYPPCAHMLVILVQSGDESQSVIARLRIEKMIEQSQVGQEVPVQILAPGQASLSKLKDVYRQVLYLKHKDKETLLDLKRRLEPVLEKHPMFAGITIQFDFDPLSHY